MDNIFELKELVASQGEILAQKDARIAELETLVKHYEELFRLTKSRQYGSSSEKGEVSNQLGLFDEVENTADLSEPEQERETITYSRSKRKGKRCEDFSSLPVEVIEYELPEEERTCPDCGNALHVMGHDSRKELKVIPAQVRVVEHRYAVYACRSCEEGSVHVPIVKAPVPEPVIKGSYASPSAVAQVMTQKYVMHVPLYRQEQDWLRQGVHLSRQTMANWVTRCSEDWLCSVYDRLKDLLLQREVLHADETTCQVLNEPDKTPTSKSYMWLYRTGGDADRHIILYEYQPGRSHVHPKTFLKSFKGYLHADGYEGYHKLSHDITVVGCWAHMRRKWYDALKVTGADARPDSIPQQAINKIGYLFHLERSWKDLPPEERFQRRREESLPLAEEFFAWCADLSVTPKSAAGIAKHYTLNQKRWLMNVYRDGRTEFSNNRIENSVRPFAVGRRNWLFFNSVKGAAASSIVYSLIETAKANGLKPFEYLVFLLERIPNSRMSEIDSLLPWGDSVPDSCRFSPVSGSASGFV